MRAHNRYRSLGTGLALTALASASHAQVVIEGLWVRAMPPTHTMTAAYGSVINQSDQVINLRGVSANFAGSAMLHNSVSDGDSARMVAMGPISLAPGEALTLSPGGGHIMLMDVTTMPKVESSVEICFDTGEQSICASAKVLRNAPGAQHDGHHGHMNH